MKVCISQIQGRESESYEGDPKKKSLTWEVSVQLEVSKYVWKGKKSLSQA